MLSIVFEMRACGGERDQFWHIRFQGNIAGSFVLDERCHDEGVGDGRIK